MKTAIGRRFHLTYTIQGVRKLLVPNGRSCQSQITLMRGRSQIGKASL